MRERDRPRLAKFLSYGDSSISGSLYPGYYVSQIYGPATAVNNNNNNNNITQKRSKEGCALALEQP